MNTTDLRVFSIYGNQVRKVQASVLRRLGALNGVERYVFLASLLLTLLMVAIPAVYGMNDRGWGFSGLTGIFIFLAVLPFFYNYLFKIAGRLELSVSLLGGYSYLVPSILIGICGILIDIIIAVRGKAKS
jgi:hypothetical protein